MQPRKTSSQSSYTVGLISRLRITFPTFEPGSAPRNFLPYWFCMTLVILVHTHAHTHTHGKFICIMWTNRKIFNLAEHRTFNLCCFCNNKVSAHQCSVCRWESIITDEQTASYNGLVFLMVSHRKNRKHIFSIMFESYLTTWKLQ